MALRQLRLTTPNAQRSFWQRRWSSIAIVVACLTWGGLALGLALGEGRMNRLTNTPFAEDLLSLHAAGTVTRQHGSAALYDDALGRRVQAATIGPVGREVYNRYMSPPHTAFAFAPLSALPFPVAAWLWATATLGALLLVPHLLGVQRPRLALLAILAFPPVLHGFAAGQNAAFTLVAYALAYWLWQRDRGFLAGIAIGLIAVWKPHLVIGPALLFLLDRRRDWHPLAGVVAITLTLAAIDLLLLPTASTEFASWSRDVLTGAQPLWAHLRPGGELTVRGFFALLLPSAPAVARALAAAWSVIVVAGFVWLHRRLRASSRHGVQPRADRALFAAASVVSLALAPHAHLYEWTLLVLPAALLAIDHGDDGQFVAACLLVAAVVPLSVRLARAQLAAFGVAIHPALPVLLVAVAVVARLVLHESARQRHARLAQH